MRWLKRLFRRDTTPRILAEPGQTLILVDRDGDIVGKVVLSSISRSREQGTEILFEDYSKYLQRTRLFW